MWHRLWVLSVVLARVSCGATQVETCLDVPPVKAGASLSACLKPGCGPAYSADLVRTQGLNNTQPWQPWSATTGATLVVACDAGKIAGTWVARSTVLINPPSPIPPPVIVPPVMEGNTVHLTWSAPTQNTDGSVLDDLASFTVYEGPSPATLTAAVTGSIALPLLMFTTPALAPGTYFFAVTATNSKGMESAKSGVVSIVLQRLTNPTPPSNLTITVIVTAGS